MKVFIVILNFNGGTETLECLNSLYKSKKSSLFETTIVVVDNGSTRGPIDEIKTKFPEIVFLKKKENLGFTGGCNVGMKYSIDNKADYVILLNNDTEVDKDLITNLVKASERENIGGVVPKIYFEKGYEYFKNKYKNKDLGKVIWYAGGEMDWKNIIGKNIGVDEVDNGQYDTCKVTELATGCCFLMKAEVLRKIGLFDERYFLYYEDADLTQRIKKAGYEIYYEPAAILWHKNAVSSGGSGSALQDYYISRNRMLFGLQYAPIRTKLALIKEGMKLLISGRQWQKKGIMDYYLRKFGKGSYFQ